MTTTLSMKRTVASLDQFLQNGSNVMENDSDEKKLRKGEKKLSLSPPQCNAKSGYKWIKNKS